MHFFRDSNNQRYDSLPTREDTDTNLTPPRGLTQRYLFPFHGSVFARLILFAICPIGLFVLGITLFKSYTLWKDGSRAESPDTTTCLDPYLRREWRSLSREEKSSYIDAVNCLALTPSVLRDNGTLYDDFPWAHNQVAHHSELVPCYCFD